MLATRHVPPWRVFVWVKLIELIMQSRPKALWRVLTLRDPKLRHAQRWYYRMGRRVWFHELFEFFFRDRRVKNGQTVESFWGKTLVSEQNALSVARSQHKANR